MVPERVGRGQTPALTRGFHAVPFSRSSELEEPVASGAHNLAPREPSTWSKRAFNRSLIRRALPLTFSFTALVEENGCSVR